MPQTARLMTMQYINCYCWLMTYGIGRSVRRLEEQSLKQAMRQSWVWSVDLIFLALPYEGHKTHLCYKQLVTINDHDKGATERLKGNRNLEKSKRNINETSKRAILSVLMHTYVPKRFSYYAGPLSGSTFSVWSPALSGIVFLALCLLTYCPLELFILTSACSAVAETWRRGWGGRKYFFEDQDFWVTFFWEKNLHFHGQNFWWPFFSHRPGVSDFPFLLPDFSYLYYVKCGIWRPFPHKKNH